MDFDAIVVGAGPAGSVAAIELARGGMRVALVDRSSVRSFRIGESLPSAGERLLCQLGLASTLTAGGHRPIRGVISAWGTPPTNQDFLADAGGGGLRLVRRAFDRALCARARQCVQRSLDASVRKLDRDPYGFRLQTSDGEVLHTRRIVDATGRSAKIARLFGVERASDPRLVAVWALATRAPGAQTFTDRTLIEAREHGWWYGAWLPDGRALAALHTTAQHAHILQRSPARWAEELAATTVLARHLPVAAFAGSPLRATDATGMRLKRSAGDGFVACGDASMAFEPLSSQGIFHALATGRMAAQIMLAGAANGVALERYERVLDEIWRRYETRRVALYRQAARAFDTAFWWERAQLSQIHPYELLT